MANGKAASDNKTPLEAHKYLTGDNFNALHDIIVDFWKETHDLYEFHVSRLCILAKKGKLHLPKNYWGIYASWTLPQKLLA